MTDLRLKQIVTAGFEAVTLDLLQATGGLIDETRELETAVIVALGTDRRALADDTLPDPESEDRRGWWGDLEAEEIWGGWPIGSRLWLLSRETITGENAKKGSTIARVEAYAGEALEPLLRRGIASKLKVVATRVGRERIDLAITIYRGPLSAIDLRFQNLWNEVTA